MLISEILTEEITLTHLLNPLKQGISSAITRAVDKTGSMKRDIPDKVRNECIKNVSLIKVADQVQPILTGWLTWYMTAALVDIAKGVSTGANIKFLEINTPGHCNGHTIVMDVGIIENLAKLLLNAIYDITLDNLATESEIFDRYFKSFKHFAKYKESLWRYTDKTASVVDNIIDIFMHELVHIKQADAQLHRDNIEYRSYLEKDKNKFYKSIGNMLSGNSTESDYRLHAGSPQEIAANAHTEALRILRLIISDSDGDVTYMRANCNEYIDGYMSSKFKDPTNQAEYAVFKRLNKLIYKEIIAYINRMPQKNTST